VRAWRKIEQGIITSERLSRLSDSARWLFTLLLVAQDDEGKYPWTPTMVRALTVGTTWDVETSDALLSELRVANVAELRDGFAVLRNGAEKNGTPANSKKWIMLYPPISTPYDDSVPTQYRLSTDAAPTVKSRVEKSREEKSREEHKRETKRLAPAQTEEKTAWPDWYGKLRDIPGFTVPLASAQAWLDKKGISAAHAEETAYALKAKWPGPRTSPYKDPWATFQHWCKRPPLGAMGGGQDGNAVSSAHPDKYAAFRRELAARPTLAAAGLRQMPQVLQDQG